MIGQDDSVNISCCVASAELTSSVLMIVSTLNTMRMSECHKEASWRHGFTWRFCRGCHVGSFTATYVELSGFLPRRNGFQRLLSGVSINGGGSSLLWEDVLLKVARALVSMSCF